MPIRRTARTDPGQLSAGSGRGNAAIFIFGAGASADDLRSPTMRHAIAFLFVILAACFPQASTVGPMAEPPTRTSVATELLDEHNRERAAARVPPLAWHPALAGASAGYARQLAVRGSLRHSSRQARPGQGENLWMGTRGAFSPRQMVASWASERRYFRPGVFPAVSRTGNWADVGHYSQMIWPTSTHLGCAIASSASADFLVCRYTPAGNIDGRRVP